MNLVYIVMENKINIYFTKELEEHIAWKKRVRARLPEMVIKFYSIEKRNSEKELLLGKVITNINNPMYGISDVNPIPKHQRIIYFSILQIEVEEIFKYIHTTKIKK